MEQPLSPNSSCLLGSLNLSKFIKNPLQKEATFDWEAYRETVRIFTRLLDNVVEFNGLPLEEQRKEIESKRRHGMGFLGLGSSLNLLGMKYGSPEAVEFTRQVAKVMAVESYRTGIELAEEKGPAPIFKQRKDGISNIDLWVAGEYMKKIWKEAPELKEKARKWGCRFTHATSIAPTGTVSFSINNNASNGIEPTFAHKYTRNIIKEGKKTKEALDVYSYELLLFKQMFGHEDFPEGWSSTDNITPEEHIDIQAAAQEWCDSAVSKTINVPADFPFDKFKDIYMYAYDKGLKGCTTFRFNPAAFSGVLVKKEDLENTQYVFEMKDGSRLIAKGNDMIEYDGDIHTAQNLYDSIKENTYGKF